jgi:hypothetical protein
MRSLKLQSAVILGTCLFNSELDVYEISNPTDWLPYEISLLPSQRQK